MRLARARQAALGTEHQCHCSWWRCGAVPGTLMDERERQAVIVAAENVAGVKEVHDHLADDWDDDFLSRE